MQATVQKIQILKKWITILLLLVQNSQHQMNPAINFVKRKRIKNDLKYPAAENTNPSSHFGTAIHPVFEFHPVHNLRL